MIKDTLLLALLNKQLRQVSSFINENYARSPYWTLTTIDQYMCKTALSYHQLILEDGTCWEQHE